MAGVGDAVLDMCGRERQTKLGYGPPLGEGPLQFAAVIRSQVALGSDRRTGVSARQERAGWQPTWPEAGWRCRPHAPSCLSARDGVVSSIRAGAAISLRQRNSPHARIDFDTASASHGRADRPRCKPSSPRRITTMPAALRTRPGAWRMQRQHPPASDQEPPVSAPRIITAASCRGCRWESPIHSLLNGAAHRECHKRPQARARQAARHRAKLNGRIPGEP